MFRFLFGLLVGLIIGAGGTGYFFSTAGGGDYLLASSQRVQQLEQELQRVSQERDTIIKKLDDTTTQIQEMAGKFEQLERRFRTLEESATKIPLEEPKEQTPSAPPNA